MSSFTQKGQDRNSRNAVEDYSTKNSERRVLPQLADDRPAAVTQRALSEGLNRSSKVQSLLQTQQMLNQSPRVIAQAKMAEALSGRHSARLPQPTIQRTEALEDEEPTLSQLKKVPDVRQAGDSAHAPVQRVTGLAHPEKMESFAENFRAIEGEKMAKLDDLLATVNEALKAEGVPPIKEIKESTRVGGAQFNPMFWIIEFNPTIVEFKSDAQLANSIYHESRHAEQAWRVALSTNADSPEELAKKVTINKEIAAQALLARREGGREWSSEESKENALWAEDFSPEGFEKYMTINDEQTEAEHDLERALEGFDFKIIERNAPREIGIGSDERIDRAIVHDYGRMLELIIVAYEAFVKYRNVNIEKDAWAVGQGMADLLGGVKLTTAEEVNRIGNRLPDLSKLYRELQSAGDDSEKTEIVSKLNDGVEKLGKAISDYMRSPKLEDISFVDWDLDFLSTLDALEKEKDKGPQFHYVPIEGSKNVRIVFDKELDSDSEEESKKKENVKKEEEVTTSPFTFEQQSLEEEDFSSLIGSNQPVTINFPSNVPYGFGGLDELEIEETPSMVGAMVGSSQETVKKNTSNSSDEEGFVDIEF